MQMLSGGGNGKFKVLTVSEDKLSDTSNHLSRQSAATLGESSVKYVFVDSLGICKRYSIVFNNLHISPAYQKSPLAKLSERLHKHSKHSFPILNSSSLMRNVHGQKSDRLLSLSRKKAFFPYEVVRGIADLKGGLPDKKDFHSTLNIGSVMSSDDYETFKDCWTTLQEEKFPGRMTLGQYLTFYNALDVLLLAESHLVFRNNLFNQFKLSPDWFPT